MTNDPTPTVDDLIVRLDHALNFGTPEPTLIQAARSAIAALREQNQELRAERDKALRGWCSKHDDRCHDRAAKAEADLDELKQAARRALFATTDPEQPGETQRLADVAQILDALLDQGQDDG